MPVNTTVNNSHPNSLNIGSNVDIQGFETEQFITDGNTVVVLGNEQQKIKKNDEALYQ